MPQAVFLRLPAERKPHLLRRSLLEDLFPPHAYRLGRLESDQAAWARPLDGSTSLFERHCWAPGLTQRP